jgi:ABC-type uncharacterized transport system substrate-binding protein
MVGMVGMVGMAVSVSNPAIAHLHEFATMHLKAGFDAEGHMSGLIHDWTFDAICTAYAGEGQDENGNGKAEPNELRHLLDEILGNIHSIGYFTTFDHTGIVPQFSTATGLDAVLHGQQLRIKFKVPFEQPVDLHGNRLRLAIYDDEFYIAMVHDRTRINQFLPPEISGLSAKLTVPKPNAEIVAFANSLSKTEPSGGGLGACFAEWITNSCR